MKYYILQAHNIDRLSEMVNNDIHLGYTPLGSASCGNVQHGTIYIQAMIQNENTIKNKKSVILSWFKK